MTESECKLGETEEKIMECMWDTHEGRTATEIHQLLQERYNICLKRSTVGTHMFNLEKKGFIRGDHKDCIAGFRYFRRMSKQTYRKVISRRFLRFWYHSSYEALSEMYQAGTITLEDLERVRDDIRRKRSEET